MLPDRVSNPGPLTYESRALPIALRGPGQLLINKLYFLLVVSTEYNIESEYPSPLGYEGRQ